MSRRYPSRPVLGVGAVILSGDSVLLIQRGAEPLKGRWSIPGGGLELGESLHDGLRREVREEVGLEIRIIELVELFERVTRDDEGQVRYHYVLADYRCESLGGEPRAGDDAVDWAWVRRGGLGGYEMTPGTAEVIEKAFSMRDAKSE